MRRQHERKVMQDNLVFPPGPPQGFSTMATTQWADGKPEPIVRELLQNCLDAAEEINAERADVKFSIRKVPLARLPGIDSYREHFDKAVAQRESGSQGRAEKLVIRRVQRILEDKTVRLLFCRDDGVGLDPERMSRLLTEGNTDKGKKGAGAFGIGHLTAFAGSDLRYVLYGGRWRDQEGVHEVASGHAILAARTLKNGDGGIGGHGYWLHDREATLFHPSPYPDQAPPLLKKELEILDDTGTVVCIAGFNDFRGDSDPVQAIARVAARNFLVAIWEGKMVVRVQDGSREVAVERETLGEMLQADRGKRRAAQKGGWLPGAQAYQAWRALEEGEPFELTPGAPARLLRLDAGTGRPKSQVQVFRNGMWITNKADELEPRHFKTCNPFVAVIMASEDWGDGRLGRLVRNAEGLEHRHLERGRLSRQEGKELLEHFKQIAEELRQRAGEEEAADEFTPEGFIPLDAVVERKAEKVPSYRPRGGSSDRDARVDRRKNGGGGGGQRKRKNGVSPRPGKSAPGRLAFRASRNSAGDIDALLVVWNPEGAASPKNELGIRVRVPSGSDSTCELPLSPQWVRIREVVSTDDGVVHSPDDDKFEVPLPAGIRRFEVRLLGRVPSDPNALEVDIVRRRVS